ncbi:MAG: PadR family transcriptional regulator [Patescibacteria group bacterium]
MITNIKGLLEFFILTIIKNEPQYGLEILERLKSADIQAHEGTVYPLLRKLKLSKQVETYTGESDVGPVRKYYDLTVLGKKRLEELNNEWKKLDQIVHKLRKPPYKNR